MYIIKKDISATYIQYINMDDSYESMDTSISR